MNLKKLRTIRAELNSLRARGGVPHREVKALARKMGLTIVHSGAHENWGSAHERFRGLSVFQIPSHPGDLNRFTKNGILDCIERYLERLEEAYEENKAEGEGEFDG